MVSFDCVKLKIKARVLVALFIAIVTFCNISFADTVFNNQLSSYSSSILSNIPYISPTGISIYSTPNKINYTSGELLNMNGLVITVSYNNNISENIAFSVLDASHFSFYPSLSTPLTEDITYVVVAYGNLVTTFPITVQNNVLASLNLSNPDVYTAFMTAYNQLLANANFTTGTPIYGAGTYNSNIYNSNIYSANVYNTNPFNAYNYNANTYIPNTSSYGSIYNNGSIAPYSRYSDQNHNASQFDLSNNHSKGIIASTIPNFQSTTPPFAQTIPAPISAYITSNPFLTYEINRDGSYDFSNGVKVYPDGRIVDSLGSIYRAEGYVAANDGLIHYSNGSIRDSAGNIFNLDGTISLPENAYIDTNGLTHYNDGSIKLSDGTVYNTDGSISYPNGTVLTQSGRVIKKTKKASETEEKEKEKLAWRYDPIANQWQVESHDQASAYFK